MARIEVDPNYSNPTFSRATAAADIFKKEDVQSVAAALSTHNHDPGFGAPVVVTQAVDMPDWFRSTGHTTPFAGGAGLEMYYDTTLGGILQSVNRSTATYGPLTLTGNTFTLTISGANAMTVLTDLSVTFEGPSVTMSNVNIGGAVTIAAGVSIGATLNVGGATVLSSTLNVGGATVVNSTFSVTGSAYVATQGGGGYLFLTDATHFISASGASGTTYAVPAGGVHLFEFNSGGYAPLTCGVLTVNGNTLINGPLNVIGIPTLPQVDLGSAGQYILPVATSIRYACLTGGAHSFEYASGGLAPINSLTHTVTGQLNASSDIVTSGGNFSAPGGSMGLGIAPVTGGYRLALPNTASAVGQGIAQAWPTWTCVDHAREYGVSVQSVDDPLGKLRAIPVYYYDHVSMDTASNTPIKRTNGTYDSSMTYGMSAAEVEAVVPELAGDTSVDYGRLMTILWAACQELDARLTAVEGAA